MNPLGNMNGGGLNLFDILVNILFGFIVGAMLFLGPKEVIEYGTKLAMSLMGQQVGLAGFASYAPYILIAPIGGLVAKQLTAVRSIKSFMFFVAAVLLGFIIAFLSQGYLKNLIS
jgi:hypothetical protein